MNYNLCLHIDSGEEGALRFLLGNAANYYKGLPEGTQCEVVVLANGPAATLFTDAHPDLRDQAAPLVEKGLDIRICANAIAGFKVDRDRLWPTCKVVPAGVVELVLLHNQGFAYVKP